MSNRQQKWNKKQDLFVEQYGLCCLCYKPMHVEYCYPTVDPYYATFEHLKPRRDGGTNHRNNLMLSHSFCNRMRG